MNKKATQFFQKQVLFFFSTVVFSPVTAFMKDTASIDLILFLFFLHFPFNFDLEFKLENSIAKY